MDESASRNRKARAREPATHLGPLTRVGRTKVVFIHALDIAAVLSSESIPQLQQMRAHGSLGPTLNAVLRNPSRSRIGSFTTKDIGRTAAEARLNQAMRTFGKTVITPDFLDNLVPITFREETGSPLCHTARDLRVGGTVRLDTLIGGKPPDMLRYVSSELRAYNDGVLSIRFQFHLDEIPYRDLIAIITRLRSITREAFTEKLAAVIEDISAELARASGGALCRNENLSATEPSLNLLHVIATHTVLIIEAFRNENGAAVSAEDLRDRHEFVGILRQSFQTEQYRPTVLQDLRGELQGYKQDELYVTLRGTTLCVLPQHWTAESFLTLYVEDLIEIIEYFISRIPYLDFLTATIRMAAVTDSRDLDAVREGLDYLIAVRRASIALEEGIDIDRVINHFFTRGFIQRLLAERGIRNKQESLKRRLDGIDSVLELSVMSSLSALGVLAGLRQVRIAIWALVMSLVVTAATTILGLLLGR